MLRTRRRIIAARVWRLRKRLSPRYTGGNRSARNIRLLRLHLGIAFRRSPNPGAFGRRLQRAAQLVDDERGQCLALGILRNDQQRSSELRHLLEENGSRSCTAPISTVIRCGDAQLRL